MSRLEEVRSEVLRFVQAVPFEPFVLELESGRLVLVTHPENIAIDVDLPADAKGYGRFHVLTGGQVVVSNFRAVTSVTLADQDSLAG